MERDAAAPPELVRLFTDGACSGNPGPGGWAFILQHPATGLSIEKSGAEPDTTNNRMELTGVDRGAGSPQAPVSGDAGDRQPVRRQRNQRMDAQVEAPGLAAKGRQELQAGDQRRPLAEARRTGRGAPSACRRTSWDIEAIRRTRRATGWPSRPTRSSCKSGNPSGRRTASAVSDVI